jgi:hypothetical protein
MTNHHPICESGPPDRPAEASMERVSFINTESGVDLIVAFAISRVDPGEIRTLSLIRTPKYEFILDDSERGVSVSDEDRAEDDNDLLEEVEFRGNEVRIRSRNAEYQLDCSRVDGEEFEETKKIVRAMNFDSRFRIRVS